MKTGKLETCLISLIYPYSSKLSSTQNPLLQIKETREVEREDFSNEWTRSTSDICFYSHVTDVSISKDQVLTHKNIIRM